MEFAVVHVVDDASFGGVNRMLAFLERDDKGVRHSIVRVKRGALTSPKLSGDIIVSHLSASWKNLPLMTAMRGAHPDTPMVHVEHSYSERFAALNVTNRDRFETLLRTLYALFDTIVAVSEAQARWLLRKGVVESGSLRVIRPCVDLEPFRLAGAARVPGRQIVGALGRFDRQKGFDILIAAFARLGQQDLRLHLYGDGPEREHLEALARGVPNIEFKGFASDPATAIAACDVIAMPSRWEPYGLVALEAMAAGRRVLCPRADGLTDHIANGAIEVGLNTVDGWCAALSDARIWNPAPQAAPADPDSRAFASHWFCLFASLRSAPPAGQRGDASAFASAG